MNDRRIMLKGGCGPFVCSHYLFKIYPTYAYTKNKKKKEVIFILKIFTAKSINVKVGELSSEQRLRDQYFVAPNFEQIR